MSEALLNKECILLHVQAESDKDVIRKLARLLYEKGYVKEDFEKNILVRERDYPTGLDTGEIQVAIPHTDPQFVNHSAIGLAVLETPVYFKNMEDPEKMVSASIVFMLAVTDPSKQVPLLTKIMGFFSQKNLLQRITRAKTEEEVYHMINELLV